MVKSAINGIDIHCHGRLPDAIWLKMQTNCWSLWSLRKLIKLQPNTKTCLSPVPVAFPDAPCMVHYLPTKLGCLRGKCRSIFHTWSIWVWCFFQADLLAEKPTLQRFTEIFGVTFPKQMSRHVFVVQHQPADCWAVNPLFLSSVPRLVKWGQENPVQPRCFRKIMVGNGETLLPDRQTICNSYYLSSVLCFN